MTPRRSRDERHGCRRCAHRRSTGASALPRRRHPVGRPGGVNFSVFSKRRRRDRAAAVRRRAGRQPARVIPLDPGGTAPITTGTPSCPASSRGRSTPIARTGRSRPERGLRFDAEKVLLDPYGLPSPCPMTTTARPRAGPGDNAPTAMKSVVADPARYDWEGDAPLRRPFAETVIYELHVARLHRHPSSGVAGEARHLRGPDREDSLPQEIWASPPSSCCRCSSSIRRTRRPGG